MTLIPNLVIPSPYYMRRVARPVAPCLQLILAIAAMLLCCAAQAGLREGLMAYDRTDYQTAMAELLPEAERGNALAQYKIGTLFDSARGVERNFATASIWFKRAAEQGHARAQLEMARRYCEWRNTDQDCRESLHWLQLSALQGNPEAEFLLYQLHAHGWKLFPDRTQATAWLEKAAGHGSRAAQAELELQRARTEIERAMALFKQANFMGALPGLTSAADAGYAPAQAALGEIYFLGEAPFIKEDEARSRYWWELAARQEDPDAQLWLGSLEKDSQKKIRWYEKAALRNHSDALLRLANIYDHGQEGVTVDHQRAARYCLQAAEHGSTQAQRQMGDRYLDGSGVYPDAAAAAKWYLAAASSGDAKAQSSLAALYATGKGVSKDVAAARYWYGRAAEQGELEGELGLVALQ